MLHLKFIVIMVLFPDGVCCFAWSDTVLLIVLYSMSFSTICGLASKYFFISLYPS
jgi:hypothetical protein